jgi:uncharacterized protein YdaU (DUF1376 family)
MNLYLHHIGDFNNATRHLTRVERSVYSDAIHLYYDTEHALPSDDFDALARKLMCRDEQEKQALRTVLAEFFVQTELGYSHARCDAEIAKYRANTSSKARAGIASAAKRKQNLTRVQQPSTDVEHTCTNRKPLTVNRKPLTKEEMPSAKRSTPAARPDDVCDEVWASWTNLRKTKRAPISATVIEEVRKDSVTAGMSLEAYLRIWCKRGSQGMEPSWIKPQERAGPGALQPNRQEALELRNRAVAEAFVKKLEREDSHASQ